VWQLKTGQPRALVFRLSQRRPRTWLATDPRSRRPLDTAPTQAQLATTRRHLTPQPYRSTGCGGAAECLLAQVAVDGNQDCSAARERITRAQPSRCALLPHPPAIPRLIRKVWPYNVRTRLLPKPHRLLHERRSEGALWHTSTCKDSLRRPFQAVVSTANNLRENSLRTAINRICAKVVDLDTDQRLVSQIWVWWSACSP
jgi:hypothetical protein